MSITVESKRHTSRMTGAQQYEKYRLEGFCDARDQVFFPEHYAKGMPRRAYTYGKSQYVELMAQKKS